MATPCAKTDIANMESSISMVTSICDFFMLQFMMESKQLIARYGAQADGELEKWFARRRFRCDVELDAAIYSA